MANTEPYIQSPFNKQRKDKFLFVLNFPDALKEISQKISRDNAHIIPNSLQFSVYGAVVPTIQVPKLDIRYSGQTLSQSSLARPPYEPVTVNFTVDNRFNNYWVIYSWLNILNNTYDSTFDSKNLIPATKGNTMLNKTILDDYKADISLFPLDEYNKRIIEFKYTRAFPVSLGGIDFNYRNPEELETNFTFTFSQLFVNLIENTDNI
jgi:hypothetical protein